MALYSTLQKFITKEGVPVSGASVNVKLSGGAVDADLFATRTGTAKGNPFLTTTNGEALCYVKAGRYDMTVTKDGDQIVFKDIEVGQISNVGTFAEGGVITDTDQLVEDADGNHWRWTGNLNYNFAVGENPESIAEWVLFTVSPDYIKSNITQWQEHTYPAFITSAVNGGVPFSYKKNSIVTYLGVDYASSVDSNTDTPPSSKWEIFSTSLINDLSQAYEFPTLALMMASLITFPLGKTVSTKNHTTLADGGGASWFSSGVTGTPNTIDLATGTIFNVSGAGFQYAFNNYTAKKEVNPMAFGAVSDGTVNNTGIVNGLLAFADAVIIPTSQLGFAMTNIAIPAGKSVYGIGHGSRVKALTSSNSPLFSLGSFASVSNISMFASGGRNSGLTLQNAIEIPFGQVQTSVDKVWFDGFGGSAYFGVESVNNHEGNSILNSKIRECNIGINASERFEYLNMSANTIFLCNIGLNIVGGNLLATGTVISDNLVGIQVLHGDNAGHGQISGALINHNVNNAIVVDGVIHGFNFAGCQIFNNGPIHLKDCNGIVFSDGTKSETPVLEENCFDCRFDGTRLRGGVDNTPNYNATSSEVFYHDCPMELGTSGLSINSLDGGRLIVTNTVSQTAIPVGDHTFIFDNILSNSITANENYTWQDFYADGKFSGAAARVRGGAKLEFVMQLAIGRTDNVTFDVEDIVVSLNDSTGGFHRVAVLDSMDKAPQTKSGLTNYARYLFNGPTPRGDIIVNIENNTGAVLTVYGDVPASLVLSRAEVTGW